MLPDGEVLFNLPSGALFDPYILALVNARFAMLRFHLGKVRFRDGNAVSSTPDSRGI